jgi:hypothetical protein
LENADYLWDNYGNGDAHSKIGLEFGFGQLRARLNAFRTSDAVRIQRGGLVLHQIFDLNYGIVRYVAWDNHQANTERLRNGIEYTYKAERFRAEEELRVTLSAIGMGHFVLNGRNPIVFPRVRCCTSIFGPP